MTIPDDELLRDIRRVSEKVGQTPTISQYREHGEYTRGTVRNHFGSWSEGVRKAGLEPREERTLVGKGEVLSDIRRVGEEIGRRPTSREYDEIGRYTGETAKLKFGSWNNAVEMAGFERERDQSKTSKVSENKLIELYYGEGMILSEVARELGVSSPTIQRWLSEYNVPKVHSAKARKVIFYGSAEFDRISRQTMFQYGIEAKDNGIYVFNPSLMTNTELRERFLKGDVPDALKPSDEKKASSS
jgi:transposase-like protein